MGLCFAPGCDHTNKNGCKMFNFPKDATLRSKWEKLVRLVKFIFIIKMSAVTSVEANYLFLVLRVINDILSLCYRRGDRKANNFSLICSCHFKDGNKDNLPTLFKYNIGKRLNFPSPERKKRRSLVT